MKQIPAHVEIDVNGDSHEVDTVSEDLFIDEDNLNEEYIKQPGTFAWYAVLTAEAEAHKDMVKFDLEVLAADLDKQVREEIELRGDKVTEKLVETEIGRKQEYRNKKQELLEATRQLNVMKAVKEGLVQKKDMLISLGANMRNEKDSNVRVLQEEVKTKTKASAVKRKVRDKKKKEMND